jgi:hypothetical protein
MTIHLVEPHAPTLAGSGCRAHHALAAQARVDIGPVRLALEHSRQHHRDVIRIEGAPAREHLEQQVPEGRRYRPVS